MSPSLPRASAAARRSAGDLASSCWKSWFGGGSAANVAVIARMPTSRIVPCRVNVAARQVAGKRPLRNMFRIAHLPQAFRIENDNDLATPCAGILSFPTILAKQAQRKT